MAERRHKGVKRFFISSSVALAIREAITVAFSSISAIPLLLLDLLSILHLEKVNRQKPAKQNGGPPSLLTDLHEAPHSKNEAPPKDQTPSQRPRNGPPQGQPVQIPAQLRQSRLLLCVLRAEQKRQTNLQMLPVK